MIQPIKNSLSKYLGVQCRQLWVHTTGRSMVPGSQGAKYEECQRKHFTDYKYIESAAPLTGRRLALSTFLFVRAGWIARESHLKSVRLTHWMRSSTWFLSHAHVEVIKTCHVTRHVQCASAAQFEKMVEYCIKQLMQILFRVG